MRRAALDPGALRTELVLEQCLPVPDGAGGHSESWSAVATLFAALEPVAARARPGAGRRLAVTTHRITLRHRPDVRPGMRFAAGGRRFLILTVVDPGERGRYLACETREEGP